MTATATAPATELNGIVLQLDNLHTAYAAILEQAKQQLEQLELSDEQADAIAKRLLTRADRQEDLAALSVTALRHEIDNFYAQGHGGDHWLLRRLGSSIDERANDNLRNAVRDALREYLCEPDFRRRLDGAITTQLAYPTGELSRVMRHAMRGALANLFDADDLRSLLDIPADEAYRTRAEERIAALNERITALNLAISQLRNEFNDRLDRIPAPTSA